MKKRKKLWITTGILAVVVTLGMYFTYPLRVTLAGTLLTTQHPQYAWVTLIGQDKINELRNKSLKPIVVNTLIMAPIRKPLTEEMITSAIPVPEVKEDLKTHYVEFERNFSPTHYFKGRLVTVNDATKVRLVPATIHDKGTKRERGEWLEEIVKTNNAIVALNASGFSDPGGKSWASHPMGLVIIDGEVIQDYDVNANSTALGITYDGRLITGKFTSEELLNFGVRDAVSFKPQLIVDGKSLFPDESSEWGYQPRSAVGQTEDGSIVLIQIDGRKAESIGASMKDMADILLEYGVVNAMAMDGGTSAFLSYNGETKTVSPVSDKRGRFLPNAWVVVPDEDEKVDMAYADKVDIK
ncbi:phosphodiester glycosidase family protein [Paenibacillus pabuli]|uniref:phosphodiester glycosidase family protein n=1 Tax=Paenibacillus pabuli TaxID=1472 RepID=UPI003242217F